MLNPAKFIGDDQTVNTSFMTSAEHDDFEPVLVPDRMQILTPQRQGGAVENFFSTAVEDIVGGVPATIAKIGSFGLESKLTQTAMDMAGNIVLTAGIPAIGLPMKMGRVFLGARVYGDRTISDHMNDAFHVIYNSVDNLVAQRRAERGSNDRAISTILGHTLSSVLGSFGLAAAGTKGLLALGLSEGAAAAGASAGVAAEFGTAMTADKWILAQQQDWNEMQKRAFAVTHGVVNGAANYLGLSKLIPGLSSTVQGLAIGIQSGALMGVAQHLGELGLDVASGVTKQDEAIQRFKDTLMVGTVGAVAGGISGASVAHFSKVKLGNQILQDFKGQTIETPKGAVIVTNAKTAQQIAEAMLIDSIGRTAIDMKKSLGAAQYRFDAHPVNEKLNKIKYASEEAAPELREYAPDVETEILSRIEPRIEEVRDIANKVLSSEQRKEMISELETVTKQAVAKRDLLTAEETALQDKYDALRESITEENALTVENDLENLELDIKMKQDELTETVRTLNILREADPTEILFVKPEDREMFAQSRQFEGKILLDMNAPIAVTANAYRRLTQKFETSTLRDIRSAYNEGLRTGQLKYSTFVKNRNSLLRYMRAELEKSRVSRETRARIKERLENMSTLRKLKATDYLEQARMDAEFIKSVLNEEVFHERYDLVSEAAMKITKQIKDATAKDYSRVDAETKKLLSDVRKEVADTKNDHIALQEARDKWGKKSETESGKLRTKAYYMITALDWELAKDAYRHTLPTDRIGREQLVQAGLVYADEFHSLFRHGTKRIEAEQAFRAKADEEIVQAAREAFEENARTAKAAKTIYNALELGTLETIPDTDLQLIFGRNIPEVKGQKIASDFRASREQEQIVDRYRRWVNEAIEDSYGVKNDIFSEYSTDDVKSKLREIDELSAVLPKEDGTKTDPLSKSQLMYLYALAENKERAHNFARANGLKDEVMTREYLSQFLTIREQVMTEHVQDAMADIFPTIASTYRLQRGQVLDPVYGYVPMYADLEAMAGDAGLLAHTEAQDALLHGEYQAKQEETSSTHTMRATGGAKAYAYLDIFSTAERYFNNMARYKAFAKTAHEMSLILHSLGTDIKKTYGEEVYGLLARHRDMIVQGKAKAIHDQSVNAWNRAIANLANWQIAKIKTGVAQAFQLATIADNVRFSTLEFARYIPEAARAWQGGGGEVEQGLMKAIRESAMVKERVRGRGRNTEFHLLEEIRKSGENQPEWKRKANEARLIDLGSFFSRYGDLSSAVGIGAVVMRDLDKAYPKWRSEGIPKKAIEPIITKAAEHVYNVSQSSDLSKSSRFQFERNNPAMYLATVFTSANVQLHNKMVQTLIAGVRGQLTPKEVFNIGVSIYVTNQLLFWMASNAKFPTTSSDWYDALTSNTFGLPFSQYLKAVVALTSKVPGMEWTRSMFGKNTDQDLLSSTISKLATLPNTFTALANSKYEPGDTLGNVLVHLGDIGRTLAQPAAIIVPGYAVVGSYASQAVTASGELIKAIEAEQPMNDLEKAVLAAMGYSKKRREEVDK